MRTAKIGDLVSVRRKDGAPSDDNAGEVVFVHDDGLVDVACSEHTHSRLRHADDEHVIGENPVHCWSTF